MKHIKKFNESDETKLDIEYIEHCFREVINVKKTTQSSGLII